MSRQVGTGNFLFAWAKEITISFIQM